MYVQSWLWQFKCYIPYVLNEKNYEIYAIPLVTCSNPKHP